MIDSRLVGGILLVAGTAIGAGMLALPVSTGIVGFFPSLIVFFLTWFFMTMTSLYFLEVSLWVDEGADLVSMSRATLGGLGEYVCIGIYLCLLYALTAAYISASAQIFDDFLVHSLGLQLPKWAPPLVPVCFFGTFVYLGTQSVDFINRYMMLGLIAMYLALVIFVPGHMQFDNLLHTKWEESFWVFPVVITAFGFHVVIPSLMKYLDRKPERILAALLIGGSIPFIVYLIWQCLVLGVIPLEGDFSIEWAQRHDLPATAALKGLLGLSWIGSFATLFAFFAIATSFLGVSLSLTHFLEDTCKVKKTQAGRLQACMLTFIPPLCFVVTGSDAFYQALQYAGIFVAILLGLYPSIMVWAGRYSQNRSSEAFKVPGGKILLAFCLLFFASVIAVELIHKYI